MFTNKKILQEFEDIKNDPQKMRNLASWGASPSISLWIPYKLDSSSYPKKEILETDDSKWFVDNKDLEAHFFPFYERNEKPDYDGVYFVAFLKEDGSYDKNHPENGYIDESRIHRDFLMEKYRKIHADENGWEQDIEFTIHCKMKHRWADEFMSFLRYIEHNGKIGHSSEVSFFADGDGDFHPEFTIDRNDVVDNLKPFMFKENHVSKENHGSAECMFDAG